LNGGGAWRQVNLLAALDCRSSPLGRPAGSSEHNRPAKSQSIPLADSAALGADDYQASVSWLKRLVAAQFPSATRPSRQGRTSARSAGAPTRIGRPIVSGPHAGRRLAGPIMPSRSNSPVSWRRAGGRRQGWPVASSLVAADQLNGRTTVVAATEAPPLVSKRPPCGGQIQKA
jgi:hypothetical protein